MQKLKLRLVVLIVMLSNIIAYGQEKKDFNPTIQRYIELAEKTARTSLDSCILYSTNIISSAKGDMAAVSVGYKYLGQTYRFHNKQDDARKAYQKSINYAKRVDDKVAISNTQSLIAHTYAAESKYKEALEWYKTAQKYGIEYQDTLIMANTSLDIGVIHARKGELYIAIEYFYKCIEYYEAIGETQYTVPLLNNIGTIYIDTDEKFGLRTNRNTS